MEKTLEKRDILNLTNDPFIRSILAPKEEIYLSCLIVKYNRYGLKQNRNLIITNMHCMNVSKQSKGGLLLMIFVIVINRKIDIVKIDAVTIS